MEAIVMGAATGVAIGWTVSILFNVLIEMLRDTGAWFAGNTERKRTRRPFCPCQGCRNA